MLDPMSNSIKFHSQVFLLTKRKSCRWELCLPSPASNNLTKFHKIVLDCWVFRVKRIILEVIISKIPLVVLNKFVRPHKVHQGLFWPSKAIFGSNLAIWGFRTFLALKISNKRVAQFFPILPAFLHLKWWNRYIFDVQGSKLAINSKNRAKRAKIGYTHMANLLKNISFDLPQNGPKYTSRTNLHFDIDLGEELH